MSMKSRPVLTLVSVLLLCACSTAPLTILSDNQIYHRTEIHRVKVRVEAVDGIGSVLSPVYLEPGMHRVTIAAPPPSGFREPVLKTYTLNLAPCTRYYIAADRVNPLTSDWKLVIEEVESVAGCDPALEWKKAGLPEQPPAPPGDSAVIISG